MVFLNKIKNRVVRFLFNDRPHHALLFYFLSAVSLAFSLIYAYERIYGDAGGTIFRMMNTEKFVTNGLLPINRVIEVLPLLLIKMGISVDKILLAFSLNQWLWYFGCALILFYAYKKQALAVAVALLPVFSLTLGWFNPVSGVVVAFPLLFMLAAELQLLADRKYAVFRAVILSVMLVFCHPWYSVLLPWSIVLFLFANYKSYQDLGMKFRVMNVIVIFAIIIRYLFLSDYDIHSAAASPSPGLFANLTGGLIFGYIKAYPGILALLLFSVFYHLKEKRYKEFIVFVASTGGYFLLMVYSHGQNFHPTFEPYEGYLFPLALMVVYYWFAVLKRSWNVVLIVLVIYNLVHFASYGNYVQTRYRQFNYMLANAQQWNESKIYVRAENYYPSVLGHDWTMPNESLILSAMQRCGVSKQLWVKESAPDDVLKGLNENNLLASSYSLMMDSSLNSHYFKVKPGIAICANTDSMQSNRSDTFFSNISITPLAPYELKRNCEVIIPVTISNKNAEALYSGTRKEKRNISYHWEKGLKVVDWDGQRTPIAMDVKRTSMQLIKIKTPAEAGTYYLVPDIVYEGIKWAGLKGRFEYKIK